MSMQRQLGELLAAACHSYAKAGQCKLHSVPVGDQHLRVLEYQAGEQKSVVAYVAHDDARGEDTIHSSCRIHLLQKKECTDVQGAQGAPLRPTAARGICQVF